LVSSEQGQEIKFDKRQVAMVKLSQLTSALVVTRLSGIHTEEDHQRTLSQFHMGIVVRFFYAC
jgi:hypothetical protein